MSIEKMPCESCPTYSSDTMSVCECTELLCYKNYKQGRADAIEDVELSLREAGYEYDENMSVGDNVGSAMLGAYAKGYNKGYEEKCLKVRADAIESIINLIDAYPANLDRRTEETHLIFATLSEIIMHIRQLKEQKNELF